jgi:hypothetical protein
MDEVDGMSAGDRGGVADLIASIKISKIPIICICNDRYSQKLKSLVNYCLLLSYRKPTKQQVFLAYHSLPDVVVSLLYIFETIIHLYNVFLFISFHPSHMDLFKFYVFYM